MAPAPTAAAPSPESSANKVATATAASDRSRNLEPQMNADVSSLQSGMGILPMRRVLAPDEAQPHKAIRGHRQAVQSSGHVQSHSQLGQLFRDAVAAPTARTTVRTRADEAWEGHPRAG